MNSKEKGKFKNHGKKQSKDQFQAKLFRKHEKY